MELQLTNLVPDEIVKALCNTLIHSLWQGIILAVITGITIILTKKSTSAVRYNLMISYLLLFTAAIVFTFCKQLAGTENKLARQAVNKVVSQALYPTPQTIALPQQPAEKPANLLVTGMSFLNSYSNTIVLIWFLIICARCIQFAAGLQSIYYLKRTKTTAVGAYWENKFAALANKMAIRRTVTVLQSGIAKLPLVIGHFKPVVLIPIGLLTALSEEEVESILLHELAHIRRQDYLVNLLQNLVEIVFFFNPAVLWVSALIKAERENCCDDMVIAQTSSKVSYIQALVSCEEYRSATPAYAMGLGGKDGHFLQRVKRMLSNNNQTLNRVEKMVLTICLISAVLITAAFSKSKIERWDLKMKQKSALSSLNKTTGAGIAATAENESAATTENDTLKNKVYKIYKSRELQEGAVTEYTNIDKRRHLFVFKKAGTLYEYTGAGKDIDASGTFYINGSVIPRDRVTDYLPIFEQEKIENDANTKALQQTIQNNTNALQQGLQNNANNGYADTILKPIRKNGSAEKSNPVEIAQLQSKINQLQAQHIEDSVRLSQSVHYGNDYGPSVSYENGHPDSYAYYSSKDKGYREKSEKIAYELLNYNLMRDKANFTYKLNNYELTIDGVKQPEELYRHIVAEYFKPGDGFNLNYVFHDPGSNKGNDHGANNDYANGGVGANGPDGNEINAQIQERNKKIGDEFVSDNLVDNKDDFTYRFSNQALFIDGVKQPDEFRRQIMDKYFKPGDNFDINYNYHNPDVHGKYPYGSYYSNTYKNGNGERKANEHALVKEIVADMTKDGIISDGGKNLSFKLTATEFVVNGKKQGDAIFRRYKDKFVPADSSNKWTWTHSQH